MAVFINHRYNSNCETTQDTDGTSLHRRHPRHPPPRGAHLKYNLHDSTNALLLRLQSALPLELKRRALAGQQRCCKPLRLSLVVTQTIRL